MAEKDYFNLLAGSLSKTQQRFLGAALAAGFDPNLPDNPTEKDIKEAIKKMNSFIDKHNIQDPILSAPDLRPEDLRLDLLGQNIGQPMSMSNIDMNNLSGMSGVTGTSGMSPADTAAFDATVSDLTAAIEKERGEAASQILHNLPAMMNKTTQRLVGGAVAAGFRLNLPENPTKEDIEKEEKRFFQFVHDHNIQDPLHSPQRPLNVNLGPIGQNINPPMHGGEPAGPTGTWRDNIRPTVHESDVVRPGRGFQRPPQFAPLTPEQLAELNRTYEARTQFSQREQPLHGGEPAGPTGTWRDNIRPTVHESDIIRPGNADLSQFGRGGAHFQEWLNAQHQLHSMNLSEEDRALALSAVNAGFRPNLPENPSKQDIEDAVNRLHTYVQENDIKPLDISYRPLNQEQFNTVQGHHPVNIPGRPNLDLNDHHPDLHTTTYTMPDGTIIQSKGAPTNEASNEAPASSTESNEDLNAPTKAYRDFGEILKDESLSPEEQEWYLNGLIEEEKEQLAERAAKQQEAQTAPTPEPVLQQEIQTAPEPLNRPENPLIQNAREAVQAANSPEAITEMYGLDKLPSPEQLAANIASLDTMPTDEQIFAKEENANIANILDNINILHSSTNAPLPEEQRAPDMAMFRERVRLDTGMYLACTSENGIDPQVFEQEYTSRLQSEVVSLMVANQAVADRNSDKPMTQEKAEAMLQNISSGQKIDINRSALVGWQAQKDQQQTTAANILESKPGYEKAAKPLKDKIKGLDTKLEKKYGKVYSAAKNLLSSLAWGGAYQVAGLVAGPAGIAAVATASFVKSSWKLWKDYKKQKSESNDKNFNFFRYLRENKLRAAGTIMSGLSAIAGVSTAIDVASNAVSLFNSVRPLAGVSLSMAGAFTQAANAYRQTEGSRWQKFRHATRAFATSVAGFVVGMGLGRVTGHVTSSIVQSYAADRADVPEPVVEQTNQATPEIQPTMEAPNLQMSVAQENVMPAMDQYNTPDGNPPVYQEEPQVYEAQENVMPPMDQYNTPDGNPPVYQEEEPQVYEAQENVMPEMDRYDTPDGNPPVYQEEEPQIVGAQENVMPEMDRYDTPDGNPPVYQEEEPQIVEAQENVMPEMDRYDTPDGNPPVYQEEEATIADQQEPAQQEPTQQEPAQQEPAQQEQPAPVQHDPSESHNIEGGSYRVVGEGDHARIAVDATLNEEDASRIDDLTSHITRNRETGVYTCGGSSSTNMQMAEDMERIKLRQIFADDRAYQDMQARQEAGETLSNEELNFMHKHEADMDGHGLAHDENGNLARATDVNQASSNVHDASEQQASVQQEPAQQEPAQQEPAQQEPAQQEPAQQEPAQQEPAQQEPAKEQEPAQQEPAQQEPAQQEPVQQEPAQQEPEQQEPAQQEPAQQEPAQQEPVQQEPAKEQEAQTEEKTEPAKEQEAQAEEKPEPAKEQEAPVQQGPSEPHKIKGVGTYKVDENGKLIDDKLRPCNRSETKQAESLAAELAKEAEGRQVMRGAPFDNARGTMSGIDNAARTNQIKDTIIEDHVYKDMQARQEAGETLSDAEIKFMQKHETRMDRLGLAHDKDGNLASARAVRAEQANSGNQTEQANSGNTVSKDRINALRGTGEKSTTTRSSSQGRANTKGVNIAAAKRSGMEM